MEAKTKVFINYRQIDCMSLANTLADILSQRLDDQSYFLDRDTINYGKSITEEIHQHLASARVLLVLIGPGWHLVTDRDNDKRLLHPEDWVRREIEIAHDQGKLIVPVLSNEVDFDQISSWLKRKVPSLAFLADLKAFPIRESTLDQDLQDLISYIGQKGNLLLRPATPIQPISSQEEDLRRELEQYFPLHDNYRVPTAKVPFKGLDYFKKEDASLFFGRTTEILKLCRAAGNFKLILLYGPSGTGKSSLLHAGILPRMEQSFQVMYLRRAKDPGYDQQLLAIVKQYEPDQAKPSLVILDQVEEMFTDKWKDWRKERTTFWDALSEALKRCPKWIFILGFRSEYYPQIRDLLKERQVVLSEDQEMHLTPLNKEGIRDAIMGVAADKFLRNQFKLKIDKEMSEQLATDLLRDGKQEGHIGPLLQFQLRKLWDETASKRTSEADWVHFPLHHYISLRKETLDELLDDQLALLKPRWRALLENGLTLDVLYGYTTSLLTASSQLDREVADRYAHIEGFSAFFNDLKNHLYLLIRGGTEKAPTARLAHDALAPLIRERFNDSDAAAQRAWRIIETKQREIGFRASFSETDIDTILAGEKGMRKIPEDVRDRMKDDQERYRRQKQDRFQLALDTAKANIADLVYKEALNKLRLAAQEGIHRNFVLELAQQLPYFFLETGQLDHYRNSLEFMLEIDEAEDQNLRQLSASGAQHLEDKSLLKKQLQVWNSDLFGDLEARHFPTMCDIPGGTFQMGSEEGYTDERPIHQVHISSFKMASTPVTFWQYGLFCLATGRDLPGDSGFGRGAKPVINLSWYEAVEYCNWLTEWQSSIEGVVLEKVYTIDGDEVRADWSKNGYRLPTEAEWEYAAREGGQNRRFGNGKETADPAEMNFDAGHPYNKKNPDWYVEGKGLGMTTEVKAFAPNALGLYDMSGNVYEWCWDWWSEGESSFYRESEGAYDPTGPPKSIDGTRVVRGGSWSDVASDCRCSYRSRNLPMDRDDLIGFRVVRRLL